MLFRTVPFVVERGRAGENVRGDAVAVAGRGYRGHRPAAGTGRVREGGDQGNVPHESDIGGRRPGVARRLRVLGVPCPGRGTY